MAKTNKKAEGATQKAQETQEAEAQETQEQDTAPGGAEGDVETPQEGTGLIDYAVIGCEHLRLRQEPSTDAPVVAKLPRGVGVLGDGRPAENGWRQVFTGRLFGWVMDQYLEPLELPEPSHGAE